MSEENTITIACPFCRGGIYYPSDREGEETSCPHCGEQVYLLSRELPPSPPRAEVVEDELPVAPVLLSSEEDAELSEADAEAADGDVELHAVTKQRLGDRKAVIKATAANPARTPPNRKKICTPESSVRKINHVFPPIDLKKEGNHNSVQIIYRHADEFTLNKKGGLIGKRSSNWSLVWMAVHPQDRGAKPWTVMELHAKSEKEFTTRGCELQVADKVFHLATDAECSRASGKGQELVADKNVLERFSFEHDDFRYLCGELVESEELQLKFDGADFELADARRAEFREYTLEFFEALRRELPLYFR